MVKDLDGALGMAVCGMVLYKDLEKSMQAWLILTVKFDSAKTESLNVQTKLIKTQEILPSYGTTCSSNSPCSTLILYLLGLLLISIFYCFDWKLLVLDNSW